MVPFHTLQYLAKFFFFLLKILTSVSALKYVRDQRLFPPLSGLCVHKVEGCTGQSLQENVQCTASVMTTTTQILWQTLILLHIVLIYNSIRFKWRPKKPQPNHKNTQLLLFFSPLWFLLQNSSLCCLSFNWLHYFSNPFSLPSVLFTLVSKEDVEPWRLSIFKWRDWKSSFTEVPYKVFKGGETVLGMEDDVVSAGWAHLTHDATGFI